MLNPASNAIRDWKMRFGLARPSGYADFTWLSAAVTTSKRCGYVVIRFSRSTNTDRVAGKECTKSARSFRSTTQMSSSPAMEESPSLRARCSTPANQPSNREKSKGFCSRVSTTAVQRDTLSCVPPRSASTGRTGWGTGAESMCQPSGDLMSVVVRLFMRQASPTRIRGAARRELHEPLPWRSLPAHGDQLHVFSLDFALGQGCRVPGCCGDGRNCNGRSTRGGCSTTSVRSELGCTATLHRAVAQAGRLVISATKEFFVYFPKN